MLSRNGNILFRKLHSMRETPQKATQLKKTTQHTTARGYTFLSNPPMYPCRVTMSLTGGQYAWFSTFEGRRPSDNVEKSNKNTLQNTGVLVEGHQRLNVEKHSPDWPLYWLVGLTDGDGSFSLDRHKKPNGLIVWNLVFKISLNQYNTRAIMKAKDILGAGIITRTPDNMISLRIRDRKVLNQRVFPLFDRIPLLSNKHYDYVRLRLAARIIDNSSLSSQERGKHLEFLFSLKSSRDSVGPIWHQKLSSHLHSYMETGTVEFQKPQIETILAFPWVSGFIEAEGSFYITRKDLVHKSSAVGRYCHGFGLTQTGNEFLMEALRAYFKIKAKIQHRKPLSFKNRKEGLKSYYKLDTTNWRSLQNIRDFFSKNLLGIKSLEFRIWERSMKHRHDHEKLAKIQALMRKIRGKKVNKVNV